MKSSPAITVNGGVLPEEFVDKVREILPEEHQLHSMLESLQYVPEAELPEDEALRDESYQPGHAIFDKFCDIMSALEKGSHCDGNLVDYFALKRHDPAAFERLTQVAERVEIITHLNDEFQWIINGDGHTQHQIWDMETPNPKLIPADPNSFT